MALNAEDRKNWERCAREEREGSYSQRILCSFELNKHVVDDCVRCAVYLSVCSSASSSSSFHFALCAFFLICSSHNVNVFERTKVYLNSIFSYSIGWHKWVYRMICVWADARALVIANPTDYLHVCVFDRQFDVFLWTISRRINGHDR